MEWERLLCLDSVTEQCDRADNYSLLLADDAVAEAVDILGTVTQLQDLLTHTKLDILTSFHRQESVPVQKVLSHWLSGSKLLLDIVASLPRSVPELERFKRNRWRLAERLGEQKTVLQITRRHAAPDGSKRRWLVLRTGPVRVKVPLLSLWVTCHGLRLVVDVMQWKVCQKQ